METYASQIIELLHDVKGNGSFVFSGASDFIPLGLHIKGVNEIGFPITDTQIAKLIQVAHKAPFGKGSQTILDTKVRSAWEIDAAEVSFLNPNWLNILKEIFEQTKIGLGVEDQEIGASLYKLLIYEAGDFFLPHKDSEKEVGMFGTLIIGLPSKHTGGQLFVRFDGKEEVIDFSDPANVYKLPYTAFYADCEHEIKPVTSGHRVCLVYNLVQKKAQKAIQPYENSVYVQKLIPLLQAANTDNPLVILLGHEYTPTNFSMTVLKHHDKPRAEVLLQAAEQTGFYGKLGLLTCYQMGDLEESNQSYGRRKRRYSDYDEDDDIVDGVMGEEIYEEYINIEHWSKEDTLPSLGKIAFQAEDIITDMKLRDGEPTEKEAEGYTGNAGMTMQYWYHYGAVVLWHKNTHFAMLNKQNAANKLAWLDYYANKRQAVESEAIKTLLKNFTENDVSETSYGYDFKPNPKDFSAIAIILIKLNDAAFLRSEPCQNLLAQIFNRIDVVHWVSLLTIFDADMFKPIFNKAIESKKIENIKHLTEILANITGTKKIEAFLQQQIERLPSYLNQLDLAGEKTKTVATAVLTNIIGLSSLKNEDKNWIQATANSFVKSLPRDYANDVLISTLLSSKNYKSLHLAQKIADFCQKDLTKRTIIKPTPPANWSRAVPKGSSSDKRIWEILTPFLQSPTQQVFDYARVQGERGLMASAISNVMIDLKMETIKKGSPHTLRLTKTQAAYELDLLKWKIDVGLLKDIQQFYSNEV